MRGVIAIIPGLTAGVMLMAQPSLDVRELLASSEPASLAWGAELAARNQATEFVPQLIGLLHSNDERVQEHALDALIRLKAKVPQEELRGLPKSYRDQMILLAIGNGYRDVLLSILRQGAPNDAMWVALNEARPHVQGSARRQVACAASHSALGMTIARGILKSWAECP